MIRTRFPRHAIPHELCATRVLPECSVIIYSARAISLNRANVNFQEREPFETLVTIAFGVTPFFLLVFSPLLVFLVRSLN